MKLLRIELKEGESLGILKGFTHVFSAPTGDAIEPLCLVGQNGTGKSRLLQCLAEIFYDLDRRDRYAGVGDRDYPVAFTYVLEYELKVDGKPRHVRVTKDASKAKPKLEVRDREEWVEAAPGAHAKLLPDRVIGYTSGQNETLSWPFLQLRDEYAKAVREAGRYQREQELEKLSRLRLEMVDYNLNLAVMCAVFLTRSPEDATVFAELAQLTRIEDVESLRFVIRLNHQAAKRMGGVMLPKQHQQYLDNFRRCATCWNFNEKDEVWTFDFYVTEETRRAFKRNFESTWELFAAFQRWEMLNNLIVEKHVRNAHAAERKRRKLSAPAPQPAEADKVFLFQEVRLRLTTAPGAAVDYIYLSDGEHQFAHIFGTLLIFREGNVLFLLDEPESHFNPKWRIEFVQFANKCLVQGQGYRALVLTTHAPFVISDCRRENVYVFDRSDDGQKIEISSPLFETYGASFDWLLEQIFNVRPPIAKKALAELDALRNEQNPAKVERGLKRLGDSMERLYVVEHLQDLKAT